MASNPLREDAPEERGHPRRGALAVLATAQLVLALDYSIVNIALPSIGGSLGFSRDAVEWVVSAYTLLFGGFLLLGGRSSDLLGRRRVFVASGTLFALASMVGGVSTTPAMLLGSRAVQGLAGGFLFPATLSLVTTTFPEGPARNRAISVWGAAGAGGLAFGAFLGGIILSALGWRWVFFVNVPVLAAIVVAAPLVLPGRRPARPRVSDFDVPGAVCVTAGAMLVVLALVQAPVRGWSSPATGLPAAVGVVLLSAFLWIEHRSRNPLMPLELASRRTLWGGMLVTAAFMASLGLQFFFLTLYLQSLLHETPLAAGLSFLPLALLIVLGNRVGGRLATRYGAARLLPLGMLIGALGLLTYVLLGPRLSLPTLLAGEVIAGFGQGIAFTTAYLVAGSGVQPDRQGVASAMVSMAQQLGGSIGLAVLVDLLAAVLGASQASGLVLDGTSVPGLLHALHWVYAAQAAIALLGAVAAGLVIGRRAGRRPGEEGATSAPVVSSGTNLSRA
jgi:EmrB/QacA subfamily drug resistance transporter